MTFTSQQDGIAYKPTSESKHLLNELTIGELVTKDYRKADIFKKYNLDFCCGGKKTVAQACMEKNIDTAAIENELIAMDFHADSSPHHFDQWKIGFLIDYIVNTHHDYVKKAMPVLLDYTKKVAKVHGELHPEVVAIAENFYSAAEELINHMAKEEQILFPYIKKLEESQTNKTSDFKNTFGTIKNPIDMMENEHETVGEIFKTIRALSNNYTPPEGACTTYKVSFLKLKEFEEDLHQHIHLENNILFPKSLQLEKLLLRN